MERRQGKNPVVNAAFVSICFSLLVLSGPTYIPSSSAFAFASSKRSLRNPNPNPNPSLLCKGTTRHNFRDDYTKSLTTMSSMSFDNNNKGSIDDTKNYRFHEIVERDAKKAPVVSTAAIAIKLMLAVPIWMTLILPLTIAYQAGKAIVGLVRGSDEPQTTSADESSQTRTTIAVDPSDIIPRPERKHDVVVLGATGFTGGLAVRHLAKTYGTGNGGSVRWAIAGRSQSKLEAVLKKLADELELPELAEDGAVDIMICDTSDASTLPSLVKYTRSVATTAGPFSLYGKGVVEACAKYGTHYADITGETSFVKLMKSKFQNDAVRSGARILSLCGHDSIPWDLSYNLLADEFATRGQSGETMESVVFQNEIASTASGGTFKTMCMAVGGTKLEEVEEKDQNILRRAFGSEIEHSAPMENAINNGITRGVPKPWKMTNKATNNSQDADDSLVEGPFVMSAVNYETIAFSHALRRDPKCSYKEQILQPDFKTALDSVLTLLMFFTSMMNPLTLRLIEKVITQPGDGPDMKSMQEENFLAVTGTATGSKGTIVQSLMYFNKDPGYLETARMLVESALCLALDEDAVSTNIAEAAANTTAEPTDTTTTTVGGFFTPGFALRSNLLKRLVDGGTHYDVRVVEDVQ